MDDSSDGGPARARLGAHRPVLRRSHGAVSVVAPISAAKLLSRWSTCEGMLSVVVVVSSLYPASRVARAFLLHHEPVHRRQGLGMGLVGAALVRITLGR